MSTCRIADQDVINKKDCNYLPMCWLHIKHAPREIRTRTAPHTCLRTCTPPHVGIRVRVGAPTRAQTQTHTHTMQTCTTHICRYTHTCRHACFRTFLHSCIHVHTPTSHVRKRGWRKRSSRHEVSHIHSSTTTGWSGSKRQPDQSVCVNTVLVILCQERLLVGEHTLELRDVTCLCFTCKRSYVHA